MNKFTSIPGRPAQQEAELTAAKRLYAEQFGDALVTNTYLKLALLCAALIATGLVFLNLHTQRMVANFKPMVIRINSIGRAEAVSYDQFNYMPQAPEIKYFLAQFCQLYYGRNTLTLKENLQKSLLFMDDRLASSVMQAMQKNNLIQDYLQNNQYGIDVNVKDVSIEDLREAPYKARVDFEEIYYSPVDRSEIKRQEYTAHFVFAFRSQVPNELIQSNPLGLAISYFREDQAFN